MWSETEREYTDRPLTENFTKNIEKPLKDFDLNERASVWSWRFGSDVTSQKDFKRAMECGLAAPSTGDLTLWLSLVPLGRRGRSRECGSQLNAGGGTRGASRQALVDADSGRKAAIISMSAFRM